MFLGCDSYKVGEVVRRKQSGSVEDLPAGISCHMLLLWRRHGEERPSSIFTSAQFYLVITRSRTYKKKIELCQQESAERRFAKNGIVQYTLSVRNRVSKRAP